MRLKENNQLKLISFLIAILLFISVNENFKNFSVLGNSDNKSTAWVTEVPLEAEYDKEKLYVVGIPNTVSVKLSGSLAKVQKESVARHFKVKLNLKNAQIGDDQKVKLEIEGLESGLEGTVEPGTITISIREKVTREFKVTPTVKNERLLIGYESKARNKQAGVKTHVIVCLTSALMMIISKEAFLDTHDFDSTRVAAQIVSGISFIGGGIIFMRDKKISGLTTAAGIWATSGIGMAIGGGLWFFGVVCSVFVMLIQWLTHDFTKQHQIYQASINGTVGDISLVHDIYQYCDLKQYQIANVDVKDIGGKYEINIQIENDKQISIDDIEATIRERHIDFKIKKVKFKSSENNPQ